jgi:hypothetical protein
MQQRAVQQQLTVQCECCLQVLADDVCWLLCQQGLAGVDHDRPVAEARHLLQQLLHL